MNHSIAALALAGLVGLCACTTLKQDISDAEAEALKACQIANTTVQAVSPALELVSIAVGPVAEVKAGLDALCSAGNEAALKAAAEADPTTAAWISQQANVILSGAVTARMAGL